MRYKWRRGSGGTQSSDEIPKEKHRQRQTANKERREPKH